MTVCYDTGVLQALLEGEVSGKEQAAIEKHLLTCGPCRKALAELKKNQVFAETRLVGYTRSLEREEVDTGAAWNRFNKNRRPPGHVRGRNDRKGVLPMLSRYRNASVAAAMVLALAVTFSFGSVRTAASELLTIFRVENVKTISITPQDISRIQKAVRDGAGQVDIENFGKVEVARKSSPGKVTLEEARAAVDFPLALPAALPGEYRAQEYYKNAGGSLNLTLDTVKTNQLLTSLGSGTLLPDELNGRTFTVTLPTTISARYSGPDESRVQLWQGRSPEMVAPGSDVGAIRDALLALPFLPESLRSQLASINDWQHTFVVPDFGGTSREVDVAGSQGVFITPPADGSAGGRDIPNNLIWQKDGVVYAISGNLTLEQALQTAASMK